MERCDFRTQCECDCRPGACKQAVASPAPVYRPLWKDFAMFFCSAAVITVATFFAVSEAEKQFAIQDKINQESSVSWKR
jgi:hypothetical protein